eukprot:Clim_evm15s232 gene=Clim_evmTU15s232
MGEGQEDQWPLYCFVFAVHLSLSTFRLPEFVSVCKVYGIDYDYDKRCVADLDHLPEYHDERPCLFVRLPSDEIAKTIGDRIVLCRFVIRVWGQGPDLSTMIADLKRTADSGVLEEFRQSKFKFQIGFHNSKAGNTVKKQLFSDLTSVLPLEGKISLTDPDLQVDVFVEFRDPNKELDPEKRKMPLHAVCGRWLVAGRRDIGDQFSLKKRAYIHTTSMDAEIAAVMANMGCVKNGDLCYDPYVGTAGLLVACAYFGGNVFGSDIDPRVLRGGEKDDPEITKHPDRNVLGNFRQYGLTDRVIDLFVCDGAQDPFRSQGQSLDTSKAPLLLDAIVTDPPYGIREGARKIGLRPGKEYDSTWFRKEDHIPMTVPYHWRDILEDLLRLAVRHLVVGGRLVYFLPYDVENFNPAHDIPGHVSLRLLHTSVQKLAGQFARMLVTMEKLDEAETEKHRSAIAAEEAPRVVASDGIVWGTDSAAYAVEDEHKRHSHVRNAKFWHPGKESRKEKKQKARERLLRLREEIGHDKVDVARYDAKNEGKKKSQT